MIVTRIKVKIIPLGVFKLFLSWALYRSVESELADDIMWHRYHSVYTGVGFIFGK